MFVCQILYINRIYMDYFIITQISVSQVGMAQ